MAEDRFDRIRESIWGTPGFKVRHSTVVSPGTAFIPQASYILETVRNEEGWAIFIQMVGPEGGQRFVLPDKVCRSLFRHYEGIMSKARKERAVKAAETRLGKARSS